MQIALTVIWEYCYISFLIRAYSLASNRMQFSIDFSFAAEHVAPTPTELTPDHMYRLLRIPWTIFLTIYLLNCSNIFASTHNYIIQLSSIFHSYDGWRPSWRKMDPFIVHKQCYVRWWLCEVKKHQHSWNRLPTYSGLGLWMISYYIQSTVAITDFIVDVVQLIPGGEFCLQIVYRIRILGQRISR